MIKDRHDNLPNFRSCLKGGNTIDYAFCSISILRSVTASTYEPFYLHSNSDHRGIVIDLNRHTLFDRPQVLVAAPQRGVMSTNHIQYETFHKHLTQYWKQHKIAERLDNLQTNHLDKNSLRSSLNNIDNDITKSLLRAENRSKRSERPPWSPDLKEASLQVKLLKLLFRQFVSNQPMTASIDHTTARINDNNNLPNPKTKQECQTLLRKAQKKLRKIRRRAQEKRTEYLNTLVQQ